jgi:hypothetical protein
MYALAIVAGLAGTAQEPSPIAIILGLTNSAIGIWFLIELGFLKGTQGPKPLWSRPA